MNPASIALFGCGYTLRYVARHFPAECLVLLVGSEASKKALASQYPYVEAVPIESKEALDDFFKRYPTVEVIVDSIPPLHHLAAQEVTRGVENIVHMRTATVRRIIYLSTSGVYGVTDGSWVDETHAVAATNPRAKARLASERLYQTLPIETCLLRVSAIYGPGRGIGTALQAGRYTKLADGSQWSNRIHVSDLAETIVQAITQPNVPGIINVCDSTPSMQRDVIDYYCETFSLPQPPVSTYEDLERKGAFTRLSNQRLENKRLLECIGQVRYPSFRDGAHTEFE